MEDPTGACGSLALWLFCYTPIFLAALSYATDGYRAVTQNHDINQALGDFDTASRLAYFGRATLPGLRNASIVVWGDLTDIGETNSPSCSGWLALTKRRVKRERYIPSGLSIQQKFISIFRAYKSVFAEG